MCCARSTKEELGSSYVYWALKDCKAKMDADIMSCVCRQIINTSKSISAKRAYEEEICFGDDCMEWESWRIS